LINSAIKTVILLFSLSVLIGCEGAPLPPEVMQAEQREHDLWKTDAEIYAPEEYKNYKLALKYGKDLLAIENKRFVWFRDYEPVQTEFRHILLQGERALQEVEKQKQIKSRSIADQIAFYQRRISTIRSLSSLVNEGRVSCRSLTKAELLLNELCLLNQRGEYVNAEAKLKDLPKYTSKAIEAISPILERYADESHIRKWREMVHETVKESKEKGIHSIIVSKVDKKLILYHNGTPSKTYEIGIGTNGSKDKLYAGDSATPEGKYFITKKITRSRYYKALLINYPNDDDRRQFAAAKKKGTIPKYAGIGGLIEIHGGGRSGMTYGCIAMENDHIDELFSMVGVGTPVTIVGAVEYDNSISSAIKRL
jgi:hypothetical protein